MQDHPASFFDGLSPEDLAAILGRLERRRFPAGSTVMAEGDSPREIYVIQSGTADIFINDRSGHEHRIAGAAPGATLGEMSVLTGQPASATVRAVADLDVVVLSESEFHRSAAAFPRIYRNMGAILSERLARSNRRSLRDSSSRVVTLVDEGAPPLLGYAITASVAWHTRAPTLLIRIGDQPPSPELAAFAPPALTLDHVRRRAKDAVRPGGRADMVIVPSPGGITPEMMAGVFDDLAAAYELVLVQTPDRAVVPSGAGRHTFRIAGMRDAPSADMAAGEYTVRGWADSRRAPRPDRERVLRVPRLTPEDERGLAAGLLAPSTPGGRAVGWAARHLTGLKVGIAFGAGSIRGYAHLGVLDALQRAGVPVDYVSGTSIGAAVGALVATGHSIEQAARVLDDIGGKAFRPTVPTTSLLSSAGIRYGVQRVAGDVRIEDLRTPLGIVAADIITRQEVVFRRGLLWPAVLASMSIPGIYPPQRMGRYMLVDGGILNPVPSNVAAEMGADVVIAIKLASRAAVRGRDVEALASSGRPPSVLQAISRSIEAMQSKITADTAAAATIVIEPLALDADRASGGWGLQNFNQGRRFMPMGAASAEAALPRIGAALPWVGRAES